MNFTGLTSPVIKKKEQEESGTKQASIALHKKAARHLEAAAKLHLEAARYHEKSDPERANRCALKAQDHVLIAVDAEKRELKIQISL